MNKYQSNSDIKLPHPRKKHSAKNQDSITKSSLFPIEETLGLTELYCGKVVHVNFDCPTNLRLAFKHECKDNGSSTCKELTKYMANYVATSRIKKNALGSTMSRFVDANFTIESMTFTQNVQSRPRRLISNSNPACVEMVEGKVFCEIGDCGRPAVDFMIYQPNSAEPIEKRVCGYHSSEYAKSSAWRFKR